jgi:hypothetical protein
MWVDFFIIAPVSLFLLWLFWYSAPAGRSRGQRWLDVLIGVAALIGAVGILIGVHATLDIEGPDRNVIAVAGAYVFLVAMLGFGWLRRLWSGRDQSR